MGRGAPDLSQLFRDPLAHTASLPYCGLGSPDLRPGCKPPAGGLHLRTHIFIGYIVAISRLPDLRRVFEYHGAEHKTISCFEAGDELTPENAKGYSRLHPRCGTSFLLIVMVLAIFVFAPLGLPAWYWLMISRIVGIPLIAGLSYEVIKWAGRNRRKAWVRTLMWPGLMLQNLTTREPDHEQLAVAIAALEEVLAVEGSDLDRRESPVEIVA